jgi:hypothetical protein
MVKLKAQQDEISLVIMKYAIDCIVAIIGCYMDGT